MVLCVNKLVSLECKVLCDDIVNRNALAELNFSHMNINFRKLQQSLSKNKAIEPLNLYVDENVKAICERTNYYNTS
jgi:hypothetical protein